jgi:biopolymer transport protein ExbD
MSLDLTAPATSVEDKPLIARRPSGEDPRFDITAMVDLVFMMNIFFLVTWVGAALAEVDLPAARHCMAADTDASVIVTVLEGGGHQTSPVYLGEKPAGRPLTNPAEIDQQVRAAAEEGKSLGKDTILIKAEKRVPLRDVVRIAGSAVAVEGMKLRLAVMEKE